MNGAACPSIFLLRTASTLSVDTPRLKRGEMRDLVPGGYLFIHGVFWSVVGLVALGTNAVAIMLSVGLVLLVLEMVKGG